MKTVSSDKSLIFWKQNRNNVNYYPTSNLFLKENYISVFKGIADEFSDGKPRISFVKMWNERIESELKAIAKKLKGVPEFERILNKFRGNCGEIFAEAFFTSGYMSKYCEAGTYDPVDPTNERFIDATAVSSIDGLPIGIQIKNYKEYNLVAHEVFKKAAAEDDLWIRHDHKIPDDKILAFLKSPHQYLFSFTDARDILLEDYREAVVLIGPAEIDAAKLQGDLKNAIPGNARFFQKIADEISLIS